MTAKTEWPSSLDDDELDELDRYLRAHTGEGDLLLDGVHGLLSALAVGPLLVLPDEWLPEVLHEPFADEHEGNRVLALLAKLNDSIVAELEVDAYEPILGEVEMEGGPMLSAAGWCEGF
ncbi:YecA family protein, partial [Rhodanobacter denitrificans]|nr:YecA family protein [Rhodanobacter denitrificans]